MENAKHIVKRLFEEPWTGNFDGDRRVRLAGLRRPRPGRSRADSRSRGSAGQHREVHRGLPRRRDHGRRADRRGRQGRDPLDGSRNAHGRARRNLPDREGRHGLRAHDLALRGREGRRGVDDLGHARDARPARARSPSPLARNGKQEGGSSAKGRRRRPSALRPCRDAEPDAANTARRRSEMSSFFTSQHMPCAECGASVRVSERDESRVRPRAAARVPALPAARRGRRLRRRAPRLPRFAPGTLRAVARRARAPRRAASDATSESSSPESGWPMRSASASAVSRGSSPSPRSSSTVTSPEV